MITASNEAGSIVRRTRITVQAAPEIIRKGPSQITVSSGETFVMAIEVKGIPRPIVKWSKDNGDVSF